MGCQKQIVKSIVDKSGEYVIALKKNQGNLYKNVVIFTPILKSSNICPKCHLKWIDSEGSSRLSLFTSVTIWPNFPSPWPFLAPVIEILRDAPFSDQGWSGITKFKWIILLSINDLIIFLFSIWRILLVVIRPKLFTLQKKGTLNWEQGANKKHSFAEFKAQSKKGCF